jgi:hypothetical protein
MTTGPGSDKDMARCWVFVLEIDSGLDFLLRALTPFSTFGAEVKRMNLQTDGEIGVVQIQACHLPSLEAERLRVALAELTCVRHAACGLSIVPGR